MDTLVFDAFEFCRLGEQRQGELPVASLPRLAKESMGGAGALQWVLQGGRDHRGHLRLSMSVQGGVMLVCQRCLHPFRFDIDSTATLVLARDEASADEMDALLADEDVDVIVGSHAMNLAELIEDDALLALPLSPRHETCPDQLLPPQAQEKKFSPFAVLKDLKR